MLRVWLAHARIRWRACRRPTWPSGSATRLSWSRKRSCKPVPTRRACRSQTALLLDPDGEPLRGIVHRLAGAPQSLNATLQFIQKRDRLMRVLKSVNSAGGLGQVRRRFCLIRQTGPSGTSRLTLGSRWCAFHHISWSQRRSTSSSTLPKRWRLLQACGPTSKPPTLCACLSSPPYLAPSPTRTDAFSVSLLMSIQAERCQHAA